MGCHFLLQCMKVKSESEVAQSCPTLHDSMDCSLIGSSVHGIFRARVPEWSAIAFSGYWHQPDVIFEENSLGTSWRNSRSFLWTNLMKHNLVVFLYTWPSVSIQDEFVCYTCSCGQLLSHARLFMTPWAITLQAPLSLGFPRQEYWSGLTFPPPGESPNSLCVTQQVAIGDTFSNRENRFWFSLELQIFKNTRIQRKEV